MALLDTEMHRRKGTVRGRQSRNLTLTTKLTETELRQVEVASRSACKATGEWLRDAALGAIRSETSRDSYDTVLAEVIGVRLLLVNVLRPLAAGQTVPPGTFDKLLDEIGIAKYQLAEKLVGEGRKEVTDGKDKMGAQRDRHLAAAQSNL